MWKNDNMVEKKHKNVVFREKRSLRSYTGHTKLGKSNFSDIIYLNWINLITYNEIWLKSNKNHVILRKFDKKHLKNIRKTTPLSWSLYLYIFCIYFNIFWYIWYYSRLEVRTWTSEPLKRFEPFGHNDSMYSKEIMQTSAQGGCFYSICVAFLLKCTYTYDF